MIINIKEKAKSINLYAFGDWHYGSKNCDIESIKGVLDSIQKDRNARVILLGDLIDAGLRGSIGAGPYDNTTTPEEQYETVISLLMPIREKIYCMLNGNHENRIYKETSIDVVKIMAKILDVRYAGFGTFVNLNMNGANHKIYATHGSSGARYRHSKLARCVDLRNIVKADIYLMAHTHDLAYGTREFKTITGRQVEESVEHYILTGHFINYEGSYAQEKCYPLTKKGCPIIQLNKNEVKVIL